MSYKGRGATVADKLPQELADVWVPAVPARHLAILNQVILSPNDKAIVKYRLATIHLAAIICQYGEAPKEVGFFRTCSMVDGVTESRISVRYLYPTVNHAAYAWLEAVGAGLDTWDEAGFDDPITVRWVDGIPTDLMMNDPEDFMVHQVNRFRLEYNERGLTRLLSFMTRVMNII